MPEDNMQIDNNKHQDVISDLIEQANTLAEQEGVGFAASALMQAAARYASFYVAQSSESRKDLKEDKDALVQDISREFKRLFAENLEDYIENYKIYLPEDDIEAL